MLVSHTYLARPYQNGSSVRNYTWQGNIFAAQIIDSRLYRRDVLQSVTHGLRAYETG